MKIAINTSHYQFSHGHKPRGDGLWVFRFKGCNDQTYYGQYGKVIAMAKAYARYNGYEEIVVMP